jgi:DNA-binding CsgD family transcriptional regulator
MHDPLGDQESPFIGSGRPHRRNAAEGHDLRRAARHWASCRCEIAEAHVISEHTMKTHVASLLQKLGLRSRVKAVVLAYESGLVRPSSGPASRP